MGIMIQTAVLVIVILAVRKLFGEKLHAYIRYGLWLLVVLRLVIPVNVINSPLSLLRITDTVMGWNQEAVYSSTISGGRFEEDRFNSVMPDDQRDSDTDSMLIEDLAAGSVLVDGQLNDNVGSKMSKNQLVDSTGNVSSENQLDDGTGSIPSTDQKPEGKVGAAGIGQLFIENRSTLAEKYTGGAENDNNDSAVQGNNAFETNSIWKRLGNVLYAENVGRVSASLASILLIIWITGSLLVGSFLIIAHCRFQSRLYRMGNLVQKDQFDRADLCSTDKSGPNIQSEGRRLLSCRADQLPVYSVKGLEAPCLAGFVHPAIYIGSDIKPESNYFRYIVTHEKVHYLHGDHIWALLRVVLVTVYWFHPFVWIAASASVRDGELACDHGTVRRLGERERMTYGTMLVDLSKAGGRGRIYSYGTMLRPGKSEIKERILRLAGENGSRMSAGLLAVLIMLVVAGCAFTGVSQESVNDGVKTDNAAAGDTLLSENAGNVITDNTGDSDDMAERGTGAMDGMDGSSIHGETFPGENLSENSDASGNTSLSGTESEDTDKEETAAAGESFDPDEAISKQRQLTAVPAALSEETPFGTDGPFLDYAGRLGTGKENIIIFHDYFGLVIYDLTNGKVLQSLNLTRIDCHMTQGDNVCQTRVSADGKTVWLHPQTRRYMFRYEVEKNLLSQVPLVKTFDVDLEAEDLFDRYLVTEENSTGWRSNYLYEEYQDEKGIQTAYIYLSVSNGDELSLGNLRCVWDDMVYVLCDEDGAWPEQAEASEGEGFPYDYDGAVVDVEILYDEPCAYSRISDSFGSRVHPVTGEAIAHEGIDYAAEEGTDVTAAADGIVYETGSSAEYGNYVVLLHANGDMTYYCNCQKIMAADGVQVKRGEKIAAVGSTGRSTGAHLHFALSRHGWFVDPAEYMEG